MNPSVSLAPFYKLTGFFAILGSAIYLWKEGVRPAAAFGLGACCSLVNLWLFDWLSRSIAPGAGARKPWRAGAFVTRYLLLLGIGYVIVNTLGVSPLPVVLGLLSSAAAGLVCALGEIMGRRA